MNVFSSSLSLKSFGRSSIRGPSCPSFRLKSINPSPKKFYSTHSLIKDPLTDNNIEQVKEAKIGAIKADGKSNRFYKNVGVRKYMTGEKEGWVITLDERIIKTPHEKRLVVPSQELALAIAAEWESQIDKIRPLSMPLMTLATTAVDVIPLKKDMVVDGLLNHLNTDVICVRDPSPASKKVFEQQEELHDPVNKWFSETFQVPPLTINTGFAVVDQPEEISARMHHNLMNFDDFTLAGLDGLTVSLRSTTLALAVWYKKFSAEDAVELSMLEENFQLSEHDSLPGYHDVNLVATQIQAGAASVFMSLIPEAKFV